MKALPGQYVDHINGDKLNNRTENLRITNIRQNNMNQKKRTKPSSSKYKGVTWDKHRKCWKAGIGFNNKYINIGRFSCEKEAARAYNLKALELFGQYARPNVIQS